MKQKEVFSHSYSKYYNLFYAEKDYSSEVEYIEKVINRFRPQSKSILEYGSGTGGHGVLFKRKGYDIFGIDQSQEMVNIAKERGYECKVDDITKFSFDKQFDVCLALFHVVSYLNSNDQLLQLFQNTHIHLKEKGIFVFDVWFSPAVAHQKPEVRFKEVENSETEVRRIAIPDLDYKKNIVKVKYLILVKDKNTGQYNEFVETHSMRHFGIPEIELLAGQSGFTVLQAEEFLSGKDPCEETWGVNFILQKK